MFKNQIFAFLLIGIFSVFLAACGDDDEVSVDASMTATVDGESWEAVMPVAAYNLGVMGVVGVSGDDQNIILSLQLPTLETTSYVLDQSSLSAIAYTVTTGAIAHTSNGSTTAGGSVVITEIDTVAMLVSGTFEALCFKAIDNTEVDITDGQFTNIPYTTELAPTESSLSVDIDGTSWTAASVFGSLGFGKLSITASDVAITQTVGFSIPEDISPGSYPFELFGDVTGLYNINSPSMITHGATSGTLVITAHDTTNKTISGTFEFTATDEAGTGSNTVDLTNGTFDLVY